MTQQTTPEAPALIGAKDAAARLGLDRSHFNRLVRDGAIPAAHQLDGRTGARLFDAATIETIRAERAT